MRLIRLPLAFALVIGLATAGLHSRQLPNSSALRTVIETGSIVGSRTVGAVGDGPRLDAAGNVVLAALLRTSDGRQVPAIVRLHSGTVEVVVSEGDPAPDGSTFVNLFAGTMLIDAGRVFFTASTQRPGESIPRAATWSQLNGVFEPIVFEGERLPAMPQDAGLADWDLTTRDDGRVVLLRGRFFEGSSIEPDSRGLWRHRHGNWEALVVRGMAAPGVSGATFSGSPSGSFGPVFAYGADAQGRVVTQSWVAGRRIDSTNDEGLWRESSGGLAPLVREGARIEAKGKVTFGPTFSSPTFGGFGENLPLIVNAGGTAVFGAVLRDSRGVVNSIWTTRSGTPQRLVSGALPLEGYGQGDVAPGLAPGAEFATFTFAELNETQVLAFEGFADEFGDFFRLTEGIWWDAPGSLTLALGTGRRAPGIAGGVLFDVQLEGLAADGSVFASAIVRGDGITSANDAVLYTITPSGMATLSLREGHAAQVVSRAGAIETRTVTSFRVGRGRAGDGSRVLAVSFSDGTSGVYLLRP